MFTLSNASGMVRRRVGTKCAEAGSWNELRSDLTVARVAPGVVVNAVEEDVVALVAATHDVIHCARILHARLRGHKRSIQGNGALCQRSNQKTAVAQPCRKLKISCSDPAVFAVY